MIRYHSKLLVGFFISCLYVSVTTQDITNPVINSCPSSGRHVLVIPGVTRTSVSWEEPYATDDSGGVVRSSNSHDPGDEFLLGDTAVVYEFSDLSANRVVCAFVVSVTVDLQEPEVTGCPNSISSLVTLGSADKTITWTEPTASDNSDTVYSLFQTHAPGHKFPVGTTLVTYVFQDNAENAANCSFLVTVIEDTVRPVVSSCPNDINKLTSSSSTGTRVFWTEPYARDNSETVRLTSQTHSPGDIFPVGPSTVIYIYEDQSGNSESCSFIVTVEVDIHPPTITNCPTTAVNKLVRKDQSSSSVSWTEPRATDNSGTAYLIMQTHSPGDVFLIGITTVDYIFSDNFGNSDNCTFLVAIKADFVAPKFSTSLTYFRNTCPSGQTTLVNTGAGGSAVTWTEPTFLDNSNTVSIAFQSHTPGDFFAVGVTPVNYVIADASSNNATCNFIVEVTEDTEPPHVALTYRNICPSTITTLAEGDVSLVEVTWTEPEYTDNSGTLSLKSKSHSPGDGFPVGVTSVTYEFEDPSGNMALCSFLVNVEEDTEPPRVTYTYRNFCPSTINALAEGGVSMVEVTWTEPEYTDNSGTVSLKSKSHSPGDGFLVGVTNVNYEFEDPSGNTALCSFLVIVADTDTRAPLVGCPSTRITHILNPLLHRQAVYWDEPYMSTSTTSRPTSFKFLSSSHKPGDVFPEGATQVIYNYQNMDGLNDTCAFLVTVERDRERPSISQCPGKLTRLITKDSAGTNISWAGPYATDNLDTVRVHSQSHAPMDWFTVGSTVVTYIFEDLSRNQATCSFVVFVAEDSTIPEIKLCPSSIIRFVSPGTSGIAVWWNEPYGRDNSDIAWTSSQSHKPGDIFDIGFTSVTYVIEDLSGNRAICSFLVDIKVDHEPPKLTRCTQSTLYKTVSAGDESLVVSWSEPYVAANGGYVVYQSHRPYDTFKIGTTKVTYVFDDFNGNNATCVFLVNVKVEDEPLILTGCPASIHQFTVGRSDESLVSWTEPRLRSYTSSRNMQIMSKSHEPNSVFTTGITAVVYKFHDRTGYIGYCTFIVTVAVDTSKPTIMSRYCPADIYRLVTKNQSGTHVAWLEPRATDDDSESVKLLSTTHSPGDYFPVGTTMVQYVYEDASGNNAGCSFIVTVKADTAPPTITSCPTTSIYKTADTGYGNVLSTWREPNANDNSGTVNFMFRSHRPGSYFPVGTTTVTYVYEDPDRNRAVCSFNVVVNEITKITGVIRNCPVDRTFYVAGEQGPVSWIEPQLVPTAEEEFILLSQTHRPGDVLTLGRTSVTYSFQDTQSNIETCVFDVMVIADNTIPQKYRCPVDITQLQDVLDETNRVSWIEPYARDASTGSINIDVVLRTHAPGDVFPVGKTQVTYVFADHVRNNVSCTFYVDIIKDVNYPDISNCPSNLAVMEVAGTGKRTVSWVEPNVEDNSGVAKRASQSHAPGDTFGIGITKVSYTFQDSSGNTNICSFLVTVKLDKELPEVKECPTEISLLNDKPGQNVAVRWNEPYAIDDSGTVHLKGQSHKPYDLFPAGLTVVSYIFEDPSGNQGSCTFLVEIEDDISAPILRSCPTTVISKLLTLRSDTKVRVSWTSPYADDDSSRYQLLSQSHYPGQYFTYGVTIVSYIFSDLAGNEATCSFLVKVSVDETPPTVYDCPRNSKHFIGRLQTATPYYWSEPRATDVAGYVGVKSRSYTPGHLFTIGATMILYTFEDSAGNEAFCTFVLVVEEDKIPPEFTSCPAPKVTHWIDDEVSNGANVSWNLPRTTDDSGSVTLVTQSHFPGDFFAIGATYVSYVSTDANDNRGSCEFLVIVSVKIQRPVVTRCPTYSITRLVLKNTLGTSVWWDEPYANRNFFKSKLIHRSHAPGTYFPIGHSTVTYSFQIPSGVITSCSFVIVVKDDTKPPVIQRCYESGKTVSVPEGSNGIAVTWPWLPYATDNSGSVTLVSQTHSSGDIFPVGSEVVQYVFEDPSENTATCSFVVKVTLANSYRATIARCPTSGIKTLTKLGTNGTNVIWNEPYAKSPRSPYDVRLIEQTHSPGDFFELGTTLVSYTFEEEVSLVNVNCLFIMTVTADYVSPEITGCPNRINVVKNRGEGKIAIYWTEPRATDNSGSVRLFNQSHYPGDRFNEGITTVTYEFVDSSGNTAYCSIILTVTDDFDIPVVSGCPARVTQIIPGDSNDMIVSWPNKPYATHNTGDVRLASLSHYPGERFPLGSTVVSYLFMDSSGNNASCHFIITLTADKQRPVIGSCPANTMKIQYWSDDQVPVTWTRPTATDNSNTVFISSNSHNSGDVFPKGITLVRYVFEDIYRNSAICSFTVSILPATALPTIVGCPNSLVLLRTRNAAVGRNVYWDEPRLQSIASSLGVYLHSRAHAPGDLFHDGATHVSYLYLKTNGNVSCDFIVDVRESTWTSTFTRACPSNINRLITKGKTNAAVFWNEPIVTNYAGIVWRTHKPGDGFDIGVTVVNYVLEDIYGNAKNCSFVIKINEDITPPHISKCPSLTIVVDEQVGHYGTRVNWNELKATDNSGSVFLASKSHAPGERFPIGETTVDYRFEDPSRNKAYCAFIVIVLANLTDSEIRGCPADLTVASRGETAVDWTEPQGPVSSSLTNRSHIPGDTFAVGTTSIVYNYHDPFLQCSFDISIIEDTSNPRIYSCPSRLKRFVDIDGTGSRMYWSEPYAVDTHHVRINRTHTPGDVFPIGITAVTYTFTDDAGNQAMCSFMVTIEDDTVAPIIQSCPSSTRIIVLRGSRGIPVGWSDPYVTVASGTVMISMQTHIPGDIFYVGVSTVQYVFEDAAGNHATCSFLVTIEEDNTSPSIDRCPASVTYTVRSTSDALRRIDFHEPYATDSSDSVKLSYQTHKTGDWFNARGATPVTYEFIDSSNNTQFCSFVINNRRADGQDIRGCPASINVDTDINGNGTQVTWNEPYTVGSYIYVQVTRSHSPGDFFNVGTSTVTYHFEDPIGNIVTCAFTVTVSSGNTVVPTYSTSSYYRCPIGGFQRLMTKGEHGIPVYWTEPFVTDANYEVWFSRSHIPGDVFALGSTTVSNVYRDLHGNEATCSFVIRIVEDSTSPEIKACTRSTITELVGQSSTGISVSWNEPYATDNSGRVRLVSQTHRPWDIFLIGQTTVQYTFADPSGNAATCTFVVSVIVDTQRPEISSCPGYAAAPSVGSEALTPVYWTEPYSTDNSVQVNLVSRSHAPGDLFNTSTTIVEYMYRDRFENTAVCSFVVTVTVQTDLVISGCPTSGVDQLVGRQASGASVSWTEPVAKENSISVSFTSRSHSPGDSFPVGTSLVEYLFHDNQGIAGTCSFIVHIIPDTENPKLGSCPNHIELLVNVDVSEASASWTEPTATDNSDTVRLLSQTHRPGDMFTIGVNTVKYTFEDLSNNVVTCVFLVTVVADFEAPKVMSCPVNGIEKLHEGGSSSEPVSWTEPTAVDNSGSVNRESQTHAPGDEFPIGVTTVTYVFEDPSQNRALCTFIVTVTDDTIAPKLKTCPGTLYGLANGIEGGTVTWNEPTTEDNSNNVNLIRQTHNSGERFPIGATLVEYEFQDLSGNQAFCAFTAVIAVDTDIPSIRSCPSTISILVTRGDSGSIASWNEPTATDNSGSVSMAFRSHSPGDYFQVGSTAVTYIFEDSHDNNATCSFIVAVREDRIPPRIHRCPSIISESVLRGYLGTHVPWTEPYATDNSNTASVMSQTHSPGDYFDIGHTTVTYIFSDPSDNIAYCSFMVRLSESATEAVIINCPRYIKMLVEGGDQLPVTWDDPEVSSEAETLTLSYQSHTPGDIFNVGTTTVVYLYEDAMGNTASCSFDVTLAVEDILPNLCETNSCEHGGQCSALDGKVVCQCPDGYVGERCELLEDILPDRDLCETYSCEHGGQCSALDGKEVCKCPDGYVGERCELRVCNCDESDVPNMCVVASTCPDVMLMELSMTSVDETNVMGTAQALQVITSEHSDITFEGIEFVARTLENVVSVNSSLLEVTENVIATVSNVMNINDEVFSESQQSNSSATRILRGFETQLLTISENSGNFSQAEDNIQVQLVSVDRMTWKGSLGYASIPQSLKPDVKLANNNGRIFTSDEHLPLDKVEVSIQLPQEARRFIESDDSKGTGTSSFLFTVYNNDHLFQTSNRTIDDNKSTHDDGKESSINSLIISATVVGIPEIQNLSDPVLTTYYPKQSVSKNRRTECVFWDFELKSGDGDWSSEGCSITDKLGTDGIIACHCDHLTNFAILLSYKGEVVKDFALDLISTIGCSVSILALILTLMILFIVRARISTTATAKMADQMLISICVSLLALYVVFLFGIGQTSHRTVCLVIAGLLQYLILVSLLWMAAEGMNFFYLFVVNRLNAEPNFFKKAVVICWGLPMIVVTYTWLIMFYAEGGPSSNVEYCFIPPGGALIAGLLVPVGLILIFNVLIFGIIFRRLTCQRMKSSLTRDRSMLERTARHARTILPIGILLGLSWCFGLLAIQRATRAFQYIFCITTSLQGLLIFLMFAVGRNSSRVVWRRLFGLRRQDHRHRGGNSGTRSGTSSTGQNTTTTGRSSGATLVLHDGNGSEAINEFTSPTYGLSNVMSGAEDQPEVLDMNTTRSAESDVVGDNDEHVYGADNPSSPGNGDHPYSTGDAL